MPLVVCADTMVFKGSVSYRNDNINYISLGNGIEVKITRMDRAFCQVSFVDQNDAAVPIPANTQLVFQNDRTPVARVGQTFIITWAENYVMIMNGADVFSLENQKQQAIGGDVGLQTRFVQA